MPLTSSEFIMSQATSVRLNQTGIDLLAKKIHQSLTDKACNYFDWKAAPLNPKTMDESTIDWIFLVDTLNFSFWSDAELTQTNNVEKYLVVYKDASYHGYWALCAAVNRALDVSNVYSHNNLASLFKL